MSHPNKRVRFCSGNGRPTRWKSLRRCQNRERILRRHHAFQRLLRRVTVINPFEPSLSYPDRHLQVRRDHPKYLQLILAGAFLHQMQRPLRQDPELGDYVEATLEDVALANGLAHRFWATRWLISLRPPGICFRSSRSICRKGHPPMTKTTFSRRELREAIHWSDTRLRVHLRELVDLEYVAKVSGRIGTDYRYRLLAVPVGPGRFLPGSNRSSNCGTMPASQAFTATSHPPRTAKKRSCARDNWRGEHLWDTLRPRTFFRRTYIARSQPGASTVQYP